MNRVFFAYEAHPSVYSSPAATIQNDTQRQNMDGKTFYPAGRLRLFSSLRDRDN